MNFTVGFHSGKGGKKYYLHFLCSDPPEGVYIALATGEKFKICQYGWWDHSLALGEHTFLVYCTSIQKCYSIVYTVQCTVYSTLFVQLRADLGIVILLIYQYRIHRVVYRHSDQSVERPRAEIRTRDGGSSGRDTITTRSPHHSGVVTQHCERFQIRSRTLQNF